MKRRTFVSTGIAGLVGALSARELESDRSRPAKFHDDVVGVDAVELVERDVELSIERGGWVYATFEVVNRVDEPRDYSGGIELWDVEREVVLDVWEVDPPVTVSPDEPVPWLVDLFRVDEPGTYRVVNAVGDRLGELVVDADDLD